MSTPTSGDAALVRALGTRQLAASIVNTTVGAGIFALPALVAAGLGPAAPLAFVMCAAAMTLIVGSFALAGSRVAITGGLYAYVEAAFGRYVGFLAGVLQWLTGVLAVASVASALVGQVGQVAPALASGAGRAVLMAIAFGSMAIVNIRGVRGGARTVEILTLSKLLPLLIFILVGAWFVDPQNLVWSGLPAGSAVGQTVLLLVYAFAGIETALIPTGEVRQPSRTVPRAIFLALTVTTLLYLAIQVVAQGLLGSEMSAFRDAPLAEAASRAMGPAGRTLMLVGAMISMTGYISGDMLGSPRTLFAFGRDGVLPSPWASVHPRFRTPHIAIITHAVVAWTVAVSSTFSRLVLLTNVALLLLYLMCVIAAFELVRRDVRTEDPPLTMPGALVVPILASAFILWILSQATGAEFAVCGAVLAVASVLFVARRVPVARVTKGQT